jgi:hypothetical protein
MYPITEYIGAKIVVRLDWYGPFHCFHIDPGDGSTIPIYLDGHVEARQTEEVNAVQGGLVDLQVAEVAWAIGDRSGLRPYLVTIKESNAR